MSVIIVVSALDDDDAGSFRRHGAPPQTPGFSEAWQKTPNGRSIHVAGGMPTRSRGHSDGAACHPAEKRWHERGV
jgi:hypothetical protein